MNTDKIKEKFSSIKEKAIESKVGKTVVEMEPKKRWILLAVIILILVVGIGAAVVLNSKTYVPLFSEVSQEEAQQIVNKLQEDGTDYQYNGDGTIMVEESVADQTRAQLVVDGYPKSGFTYDVFKENAGGMTTDSERQTYKLYELQNRIGATICLFDGVKDAKVTIALKEEQKYALQGTDEANGSSSASAVVTMDNGGSPTKEQAIAIQRLVAKSVPNMKMEDVAVFDGNGIDVSTDPSSTTSAESAEEVSKIIETQLTNKVVNVLAPFYGPENIRVSAKGRINMEKVVRESVTYTTPEKAGRNDKKGITSHEELNREATNGGSTAGGVPGSETNADVSENTVVAGNGSNGSYASESEVRDYLVNQIKEQGEIDPGVLDDVTVSVSVNGTNLGSLNQTEAEHLIATATGIQKEDVKDKITVVAAPFYSEKEETEEFSIVEFLKDKWIFIVAALILLIIIIIVVSKLLKRGKEEDALEGLEMLDVEDLDEDGLEGFGKLGPSEGQTEEEFLQEMEEFKKQKAAADIKNERSRELRETVRDFADENPEISAQMIKLLLNGGDPNGKSN